MTRLSAAFQVHCGAAGCQTHVFAKQTGKAERLMTEGLLTAATALSFSAVSRTRHRLPIDTLKTVSFRRAAAARCLVWSCCTYITFRSAEKSSPAIPAWLSVVLSQPWDKPDTSQSDSRVSTYLSWSRQIGLLPIKVHSTKDKIQALAKVSTNNQATP